MSGSVRGAKEQSFAPTRRRAEPDRSCDRPSAAENFMPPPRGATGGSKPRPASFGQGSHGEFQVKHTIQWRIDIAPALVSASKLRAQFPNLVVLTPDQTHIRSPRMAAAPKSRLRRARLGGRDPSRIRLFRPGLDSVGPFGSVEIHHVSLATLPVQTIYAALFITAPSMTTPADTYFHNATKSLRAIATIAGFLRRPPLWRARSLKHRANADRG